MKRSIVLLGVSALVSLNAMAANDMVWNERNNPENFGKDLETSLEKLPRSGKLEKLPWSGDYWPTYKGGITYRWNQPLAEGEEEKSRYAYRMLDINFLEQDKMATYSPAEKYDIFIGASNFPLTTHERNRTNILKTVEGTIEYDPEFKIPTWEGLCHAWAPATVHYDNPEPVKLKNKFGIEVEFGSSDIKALLTYFLHTARTNTDFMGSRCELSFADLEKEFKEGKITEEELIEKIESSECADTHPAAFHIALINQIGIKKESFIVDMTRDAEVWNQAVYSYSTQYYPKRDGLSEGAPESAVKEIYAQTYVDVIVEVPQTWEKDNNRNAIKRLTYVYTLALDKDNKIVGGKWISKKRPDFIWKSAKPKFQGFFAPLKEIYGKSVSYLYKDRVKELKKIMLNEGKKNLNAKKFIENVKGEIALNKFRNGVKTLTRAEAFIKETAKLAMERKIRKDFLKKKLKAGVRSTFIKNKFLDELKRLENLSKVKKGAKATGKAALFIKGLKTDVKITKAKEAVKNKLKADFNAKKFVDGVKSEVRKDKALKNLKKSAKADFNMKKFVAVTSSEANKTRAKKTMKKLPAAGKFIKNIKKAVLESKFVAAGNTAIASTELSRLEVEGRDQRALNNRFLEEVAKGNVVMAKKLADEGAEIFARNNQGETALMITLKTDNYGMFLYLIGRDALLKNINAVDRKGYTALVHLVLNDGIKSRHKIKYVEALISVGININIKDKSGKTAYRHSLDRGYFKEFTLNRFFKKADAQK